MNEGIANKSINREERVRYVQAWRDSGLKQRDFCEQHGLAKATFAYWVKYYSVKPVRASGKPLKLLPASTDLATREAAGLLVLHFSNGCELRVPELTNSQWVLSIIQGVLSCKSS